MSENRLPELPDPYYGPDTQVEEDEHEGAYTANQMRTYGRRCWMAALAQQTATTAQGEQA